MFLTFIVSLFLSEILLVFNVFLAVIVILSLSGVLLVFNGICYFTLLFYLAVLSLCQMVNVA